MWCMRTIGTRGSCPRVSWPIRAVAAAFRWREAFSPIHNLAYQGLYPAERVCPGLGLPASRRLPWKAWSSMGSSSFMKAGLHHADAITTVSPTYAREIQTEPWGCGLGWPVASTGSADVHGVLNGVDARLVESCAGSAARSRHYSHEPVGVARQICKRDAAAPSWGWRSSQWHALGGLW